MVWLKKYMNKENIPVVIGFVFVVLGVALLSYNYLCEKRNKIFENMELAILDEPVSNSDLEQVDDPKLDEKINDNEEKLTDETNKYIGKVEIPKINLIKGFVDKDSRNNNISKNVTILKESDMPDVDKGNFILVAHSGSAYISFFRNLYKLGLDDVVYVYYNNYKYTYSIKNIYNVEKTGTVQIKRDWDETTLTLITCTENDDYHQTVYISYLVEKVEV